MKMKSIGDFTAIIVDKIIWNQLGMVPWEFGLFLDIQPLQTHDNTQKAPKKHPKSQNTMFALETHIQCMPHFCRSIKASKFCMGDIVLQDHHGPVDVQNWNMDPTPIRKWASLTGKT